MTHADGSEFTRAEKLAILTEARETAAQLLAKLELLAELDSEDVEEGL